MAQLTKEQKLASSLRTFPPIIPLHDPDSFVTYLFKHHSVDYSNSVFNISKLENLSEEDARERLEEIIGKVTIIRRFLMVNGQQPVENIYIFYKKRTDSKNCPLFTSSDDLNNFMLQMRPIFILQKSTDLWRNSGQAFCQFAQFIRKTCEETGQTYNDDALDDLVAAFEKSSNVPVDFREDQQIYKKKELYMDLKSYKAFATDVPGFQYDAKTGLSSVPGVFLGVQLPILVFSVDERRTMLADTSRVFMGSAKILYSPGRNLYHGEVIYPPRFHGIKVTLDSDRFLDYKEFQHGKEEDEGLGRMAKVVRNNVWEQCRGPIITFKGIICSAYPHCRIDIIEFCKEEISHPELATSKEMEKLVMYKRPASHILNRGVSYGMNGVWVSTELQKVLEEKEEELAKREYEESLRRARVASLQATINP